MQESVDLVIRGRVVAVREGRPATYGEAGRMLEETDTTSRSTLLDIEVDEVLAGSQEFADLRSLTNLEVVPLPEAVEAKLPSEPAIFFLVAQDRVARRSGLSEEWEDHGRGYWGLTHPDGIQVERDGGVVGAFEPSDHHPGDDGNITQARTIDELAEEVRGRRTISG